MKKNLSSSAIAYALATPFTFALPPDSTLETVNDNEALVQVLTDPMGFGWYPGDAESWENVHLTDFADYLVASNASAPGLRYEKAASALLSLEEIFMPELSGANSVRGQPLTFFSFDDGADEFFDAYAEFDYFGVSWVGGATEDSFMRWRVDAGRQPYQVVHWWNHGLNDRQVITATLYAVDGTPRASGSSDFKWPGNANGNYGFTSFITVHPVADTDYLIIENRGTNVGWRATAAYFLENEEPPAYSLYPLTAGDDGYQVDDVFGRIRVETPELGHSDLMGSLYVGDYPWIYQVGIGWVFHYSGTAFAGMYLYSPSIGWIFAHLDFGGYYYYFTAPGGWSRFQ